MEVVQTLGKYEIRGTLGRGAMGIVYDGWDPRIERRVAIKAVRLPEHPDPDTEDEIARFRREAQAAGRLTHPNIVGVYDYGETSDLAYIVMEFVDGTTLKALLDKQERFAVAEIRRIMHDLLTGLQVQPRQRGRASRHQAGQHHADQRPAGEDRRFRDRPDREQQHDPGRHRAGDARLHVTGAVHGPGGR